MEVHPKSQTPGIAGIHQSALNPPHEMTDDSGEHDGKQKSRSNPRSNTARLTG
ncbi:hypothetical protein Pan258_27610 [Symmachiella dynata]|nr:hypothetical protein Pan258_27610 [Symmachiella dynata]